ncbi:HAMP domain-containing sensor histidine kinase [Pseudonocardia xishanensis]|uniref:Signal transduction histidine-protein kinase/phosphatase MprB n=1 Tax=Pseudonocardia xishanensis TaxID=630995 RepID=A0ABP8RKP8_9PSEU
MRRRVLLLVAAITTLLLLAFLVPLAVLVRTVAEDRAVATATAEAQSLVPLVATTDRESLRLAVEQVSGVAVFLPDGTVLGSADRTPLVELGSRGVSASAEVPGGREIVTAVRDRSGAGGAVRAFVPDAELTRGVARSWLILAALGVALLAVGLLLGDRLARAFVRGATDLAGVSERLARGELQARADPAAPGELGSVARALNGLAARISELLHEERESVADVAHRVRTPLTALRLEAESLGDPAEAARIGAAVDEVARAVTGAIAQARQRGGDTGNADAAAVVAERVAFWAVLAEDTDRPVTVDLAPGPLPVAIGRTDLAALVDALLGNVFAHTPDGTAFAVRLRATGAGAELEVADAGPGPPDAKVLGRGVSGAGSTGLGLDIARRSAERSGGGLRLESAGGLRVVVELGRG